jgi:tetratricopeptide (TPR) repeat protein
MMPHSYRLLARALLAVGREAEAIHHLEELQSQQPDGLLLGALADVLALCGKKKEAHAVIARIKALTLETVVSPLAFAYAYSGLGQPDQVLDWLERATDESWTGAGCISLDSRFDPVRSHPRFQAILKRMNLA